MLTFTPQADLSLLCAACFYYTRTSRAQRSDLCLSRGPLPIVHGILSFGYEPFSFTSALFLSGHFGFACGPFSTSQMDRFLSQRDLCLSLADLFVRAGLLYTICRPLSLIHGPYSFTRSQWAFSCHKLYAYRPPSPRGDLFYCASFVRESNRFMLQQANSSHC